MNETAVFDFFVRRLPPSRNYLVACGLDQVLEYLEDLSFSPEALRYLKSLNRFSDNFIESLRSFHFIGDVYAIPEGTVIFSNEPLIEVVAPLPQAQLVETFVMNQVQFATLAASKAARVVRAAKGRSVVDYGLRRIHGADAGIKAARAFFIAGVSATSNVLAGQLYGIPVSGTMAHSFIQACENEITAFRKFVRSFPDGILLVDTYDTLEGVRRVIDLAREMGQDFHVSGVRLDSGDLLSLSGQARQLLDASGLQRLKILASSSLDEYEIERLLEDNAPIDGFGVGAHMGVSEDAPFLDCAYKLVEYAGRPRMKLSKDKETLPGRKQVFRRSAAGIVQSDVIGCAHDVIDGKPLLQKVMEGGKRMALPPGLGESRDLCHASVNALPQALLDLSLVQPPYPVHLSSGLKALRDEIVHRFR
jgi:nicotinate phosphoribosyltransferase